MTIQIVPGLPPRQVVALELLDRWSEAHAVLESAVRAWFAEWDKPIRNSARLADLYEPIERAIEGVKSATERRVAHARSR